jgi:hypothetical protein
MEQTIASGRRMGKRLVKRIILILLAVFVISGMLAGMLILAPLGLSVRQTIAETILGEKLDRPITVLGNVSVDFQKTIRIAVSDAYFLDDRTGGSDATQRAFRRISFQAPYSLLLGQTSGFSNFEISGIVFEFNSRTHEATDGNPLSSTLLTHLLSNPFFENIRFSDAAFRYSDPENGWNEELKIAKLLVETPQQSKTSTLNLHADLNNTPITLAGKIQKASAKDKASSATVQIDASSSSFTAAFAGVVDYSEPQAQLDGDLTAASGSLADLLQVLGIESGLEARASYASRLAGPVDALRHNHLEFSLETAAGTAFSVTGTLDQGNTEQPVDVSFTVDLSKQSNEAADENLAVTVLGLSGNVRGSFGQVELLDGRIATSAAVLDLQEIGPISARRVIKNPDGTVRLTGLSVQGGRRDAPTLSLSGEIGDLVDLRQVDLDGRYDFPTEALLNLADTAASQLGTLSGNIRLNDQDGVFGLKDLTGKVSGTDLFDLSYELEVPELRYIDEFSYRIAFAVPEFSRFLAALGGPQRDALEPFSFDGRVTLSDNLMALKGDMLSGASNIVAALSLTEPEAPGALVLTGDISSEELDFSDFRNLFDLAQTQVSFKTPDIERVETPASSFAADLDLTIGELVSNGKRAGNVQGNLAYADKAVALAPFSLAYLGGTLNGDFSADFAKRTRCFEGEWPGRQVPVWSAAERNRHRHGFQQHGLSEFRCHRRRSVCAAIQQDLDRPSDRVALGRHTAQSGPRSVRVEPGHLVVHRGRRQTFETRLRRAAVSLQERCCVHKVADTGNRTRAGCRLRQRKPAKPDTRSGVCAEIETQTACRNSFGFRARWSNRRAEAHSERCWRWPGGRRNSLNAVERRGSDFSRLGFDR